MNYIAVSSNIVDLKFQLGQQILEFKHSEVCFTTFPGNIHQVILICK